MDTAASRAILYVPEIAFDRPVPTIPAKVFSDERRRAFAPATPTGFVTLDQSEALGSPWPATTPVLLARYIVLRRGETFTHSLNATAQVYYVIRGAGETRCGDERFDWAQGDAFCLPGNTEIVQQSQDGAILLVISNEPELSYLRASADPEATAAIKPTHYRAEDIDRCLSDVHAHTGELKAAGKSVLFLTELMEQRRVATPTIMAAINSLEPGGDQRPHRHSSAALTLAIQGEGVHSMMDGEEIPWEPDTVIVTPPYVEHSHHNRGSTMMRSFVVQDTGLYTELRSSRFTWTD